MNLVTLSAVLLLSLPSQAKPPLQNFFGHYEVVGCKTVQAESPQRDLCAYKNLLVHEAPAVQGDELTNLVFSGQGLKEVSQVLSRPSPEKKFLALSKQKDGSYRYKERSEDDGKIYIYTDLQMKRISPKKFQMVFKQSITPIGMQMVIHSSHVELQLTKR